MLTEELQRDIATISRISAVPSILKVVAELTGMRVTMVARVKADSWTACAAYDRMEFGLQVGTQLDVATTLCKEVCDHKRTIVVRHASQDPDYQEHRTPKMYNIESYIAIPIIEADGSVFGTLCAIDSNPAELAPRLVTALTHFTDLIAAQLALETQRNKVQDSLIEERKISLLREQFIAILGHDLRTPLGGIAGTVEMMKVLGPASVTSDLVEGLSESVHQMAQLIAHTMDFARSRMGDGIGITKAPVDDVGAVLAVSVQELSLAHRARDIRFSRPAPIAANIDAVRMRQVFSNLVGNALQHSPSTSSVVVALEQVDRMVRFTVSNQGEPLSEEMMRVLFQPFHRRQKSKREGLGLGLYIASEIIRAHDGSIFAESDSRGTTFTVLFPGVAPAIVA